MFCIFSFSACVVVESDELSEKDKSLLICLERIESNEKALKAELEVVKTENVVLKKVVNKLHNRDNEHDRIIDELRAQVIGQEEKAAEYERIM